MGDGDSSEIRPWADGTGSAHSRPARRGLYVGASDYSDRAVGGRQGRQDGRSATMPGYGYQHAERPGAAHQDEAHRTRLFERPRDLRVGEDSEQGLPDTVTPIRQRFWNTVMEFADWLYDYASRKLKETNQ